MDVLRQRLDAQRLIAPGRASPADVVRGLGAVQAQDYGGARWAVAQRARGLTAAAVDDALAEGSIVRTHVLRPTWHLVAAEDVRWLLALTAPRVKALTAYGNRESGLDADTIATSTRVIAGALAGRHLTRVELGDALRSAGVEPRDGGALGRLVLAAELDGVICSGAMRGRQHTYALLDERVLPGTVRGREEAVAELAARYFAGHGPATVRDFAWWSGLTVTDARAGIADARSRLQNLVVGPSTYWLSSSAALAPGDGSPSTHLLPNFDEYTVGYAQRDDLLDAAHRSNLDARVGVIMANTVVVDGRVAGTWKRTVGRSSVRVAVTLFARLSRPHHAALLPAIDRYAAALELPVQFEVGYYEA